MLLSLSSHLMYKPCSPSKFWPAVAVHMCLGVCTLNEFTEIKVKMELKGAETHPDGRGTRPDWRGTLIGGRGTLTEGQGT